MHLKDVEERAEKAMTALHITTVLIKLWFAAIGQGHARTVPQIACIKDSSCQHGQVCKNGKCELFREKQLSKSLSKALIFDGNKIWDGVAVLVVLFVLVIGFTAFKWCKKYRKDLNTSEEEQTPLLGNEETSTI